MTIYAITDKDGKLLPVVPSHSRTIAICRAMLAGYSDFKVKECK